MMPLNGSDQYPKEGWSTGRMRMAKRAPLTDPGYPIRELEGQRKKRESRVSQAEQPKYPMLGQKEWDAWLDLRPKDRAVHAPKDHKDLPGMLRDNPNGFVVDKDNPNIKDIEDDAEILTIPNVDNNLFVRPRTPLVS